MKVIKKLCIADHATWPLQTPRNLNHGGKMVSVNSNFQSYCALQTMFLIKKVDQKIKFETPALKKTILINFTVNTYFTV
jgi:hypothetical protein